MLKVKLPVAALLAIFTAVPVQAESGCYMDMGGRRIDLSHMCGTGSPSSQSAPVAIPEAPRTQPVEVVVEEPVTFQVTRAKYNRDENTTTITGLVVFPPSSEYGESRTPWVIDQRDDSFVTYMPRAVRVRGQRRITVTTDVYGRRYLRDLEGQVN